MRKVLALLLAVLLPAFSGGSIFAQTGVAQTNITQGETRRPVTPVAPLQNLLEQTPSNRTSEWQVCNETSYVLRAAHAFVLDGTMTAQGWDEILPGACLSLRTPAMGPRFLFAESLDAHQGGIREWKGATDLCVLDKEDFVSPATETCSDAGKSERAFFAVRPGEPLTSFVEPSDYGREKSVVAAHQRLLQDAGYTVGRIDGLTGRRTSRLLQTFRTDAGLDSDVTGAPLIQALIDAARAAKSGIGLDVCNGSSAPIWTAIAVQEDGRWRSRGWWRAEPETCTRPIDTALTDSDAHVYALQESEDGSDKRLRSVATAPAQFCIAESVFDALGNDQCLEQGYVLASFRPVPTDSPGARIRLTDADFAEQRPGGLRR